jgi:hypothetical protein
MLKRMLAASIVGLSLFLAGAAVVVAESDRDRSHDEARDRVVGLVQAEHGQTFEVKTRGGEIVDVHWTPSTRCFLGGEASDCDAINPGDVLGAAGSYAGGSGQFQAEVIKARRIDRMHFDRIAGIVERDGGSELLVNTREGEVLVLWGDDTTCRTREAVAFDCDRIEVSDRIAAAGELEGREMKARLIVLLPERAATDITRVRGVVDAAQGRVIVVETRDGVVNVHWDAETVCSNGDARITCDSIEEGLPILAAGEELGGHNLDAKSIVVRVPSVRPHDVRPTDVRPTDVRPLDARTLDGRTSDLRSVDAAAVDALSHD